MRHVYKTLTCKAEADSNGLITAVASTPDPDRMGDVVAPSWNLDEFKLSPVIMHNHDYEGAVVGKAVDIELVGDTLMIKVLFDENETNPLGQRLAHQYREGFMSAFSVGFSPKKVTPRSKLPKDHPAYSEKSGGSYMENNALLEVSAVSIPANPRALAVRAKRWDMDITAEQPEIIEDKVPHKKHILSIEETEDTFVVTYAKGEHEEMPEESEESEETEQDAYHTNEEEDEEMQLRSIVRDELLTFLGKPKNTKSTDSLDLFLTESPKAEDFDELEALFNQD